MAAKSGKLAKQKAFDTTRVASKAL